MVIKTNRMGVLLWVATFIAGTGADFSKACFAQSEAPIGDRMNIEILPFYPSYNPPFTISTFTERFFPSIEECTKDCLKHPKGYRECAGAYYRRGYVYWIKKENKKAVEDFSEVIRSAPEYTAAYIARAMAKRSSGDDESALADLDEAIHLKPNDSQPYILGAAIYAQHKQSQKAVDYSSKAIKIEPNNEGLYVLRADQYHALRQDTKALEDCNLAISINKRDRKPYLLRSRVFRDLGQELKSVADSKRAILLDPDHADPFAKEESSGLDNDTFADKLFSEGLAALRIGAFEIAISKLRHVLTLDPSYPNVYVNIAKAYNGYGVKLKDNPRLALEKFIMAFEFSCPDLVMPYDFNLRDFGLYALADSALKRLGKDPQSYSDWLTVTEQYMAEHKYDEATGAYMFALERYRNSNGTTDPAWPISRYFIGPPLGSGYLLRLIHRLQEHWQPPKGYENAEVTVSFAVKPDGSFSDIQFESYSNHGIRSNDLPVVFAEAAAKAVKASVPFEIPYSFSKKLIPIYFYYRLGSNELQYGINVPAATHGVTPLVLGVRQGISRSFGFSYQPPTVSIKNPLKPKSHRTDAEAGPYLADLRRKIRACWKPPKGMESRRILVAFKVHHDGKTSDLSLVKSSGIPAADQAALKAVLDAAPFSEFPSGFPSSLDLQFAFDYNVFTGGRAF